MHNRKVVNGELNSPIISMAVKPKPTDVLEENIMLLLRHLKVILFHQLWHEFSLFVKSKLTITWVSWQPQSEFWPRWFVGNIWVIKIKRPMILCGRNTSRSREPDSKRRSSSENRLVNGLFSRSQNNKIYWFSNMAYTFLWEINAFHGGIWVSGLFPFWLCCTGADWLWRQTPIMYTHSS